MFKSLTATLGSGGKFAAILRTDPGAPAPVRKAALWMYSGAAVSAVSLILSVIGAFSLRNDLVSANAQKLKAGTVTMTQINNAVTASIVYSIVVGLAAVALWIWMAKTNASGRGWARISATIFFALWSIYAWININSLKGGMTITVPLLIALVLLLVIWVIGVGAIYLLWRPVSTSYFKAKTAARR